MRIFIRGLQVLLVLGAVGVAARIYARNNAAQYKVEFALSVLGERVDPDGSHHGVDLLAHPAQPVDGYQVAVTPTGPARVLIDELSPREARRLYPDPSQSGELTGGRTYALPGAHAFYEVHPGAKLRVTVLPAGGGQEGALDIFGPPGVESLTLGDNQPFVTSSHLYRAQQGGHVDVQLPLR